MRIRPLLVCIAVVLGVAIESNAQSIPDVDFCDLFDSYEKYEGKTISSTALMTYSTVGRLDGDESAMYSLTCNDPDHIAHISYGRKQSWNFLKNLKPETRFIFAIKFVGRITIAETLNFGHLGWTRADVKIERVKSSQSLPTESKSNRPNYDAPSRLTERARQLQAIPSQFLPSLYIPPNRMPDDVSSILSNDFIFTKKDGSILSKDDYLKSDSPMIASNKGGSTSIGMRDIKRDKNGLSAIGVVKTDLNTPHEKTFRCLLSFRLKDGHWVINSARLK
jgi:hypothetical protein